MRNYHGRILVACLVLVIWSAASALSQPQPVPKLTERALDKASYVALAKEWKEYIEKYGESAEAYCNLGMAYRYSGEMTAAREAGKRAFEIEPGNPKALHFYAMILTIHAEKSSDMDKALELLERCRGIDPDNGDALTTLAVIHMKRGEHAESEKVLKIMFDRRVIPRPLQDYAYNMLVGLPHGAVLITNGDNDTFPPLALQAGMDFRKDVIVINRSLLNFREFAEAIFERYPSIKPSGGIEPEQGQYLSKTLLKRLVDEQKVPVYFHAPASPEHLGFSPELTAEGMNMRTSDKGLTPEESARLFLETYRMDSATDWTFAWDLVPSIAGLQTNYVRGMLHLVQQKGLSSETKRRILDKASEIATFHDWTYELRMIKSLQKK